LGYELWEEFGGKLPDVIVYPTGGGVGDQHVEGVRTGPWASSAASAMISAQAAGCADRPRPSSNP
jgi:threonine synthase